MVSSKVNTKKNRERVKDTRLRFQFQFVRYRYAQRRLAESVASRKTDTGNFVRLDTSTALLLLPHAPRATHQPIANVAGVSVNGNVNVNVGGSLRHRSMVLSARRGMVRWSGCEG